MKRIFVKTIRRIYYYFHHNFYRSPIIDRSTIIGNLSNLWTGLDENAEFRLITHAVVVALGKDVPRGRKWWVRRRLRLSATISATTTATRTATASPRLRTFVQTSDPFSSHGSPISFLCRFCFTCVGKNSVLATWRRNLRCSPCIGRSYECFQCNDGSTHGSCSSSCWSPSYSTSPFYPCSGCTFLCSERCDDVVMACLWWRWISTCIAIRHGDGLSIWRGSGVRQLRGNFYTVVAKGRHWSLSLQRMRALSQDERHESTAHQTVKTPDGYETARIMLHKLWYTDNDIVEA